MPALTVIEARPPEFSDESLALKFAERHADDLRYVAMWGQWLTWDSKRWRRDLTLKGFDLVRAICREISAQCNSPSVAKAIASAHTVAAVERLAKADRRLAATVEQWDCDPWLLNTPGGTVDLRTGKLRDHRRGDYCTKITAVAPGGPCPRWLAFVDQITGDDRELGRYLCRVAGYALTGRTQEHALFFLYGTGGNGKGTLLVTLANIMGDYALASPIETFTAAAYDRHATELARLQGARLVTASEPAQGKLWNEARIKLLTGGDKISARFMYQNLFEFEPQLKLVISGNHRPSFRVVNEAIRRRLHLIPFAQSFRKPDRELAEKLKEEAAGILAWMIEGCSDWLRIGLAPPPAVRQATEIYLEAEDTFGEWLKTCCHRVPAGWTGTGPLHGSWAEFAREKGEEPGSEKTFAEQMQQRGYEPKRRNTGRGFLGVVLRQREAADG